MTQYAAATACRILVVSGYFVLLSMKYMIIVYPPNTPCCTTSTHLYLLHINYLWRLVLCSVHGNQLTTVGRVPGDLESVKLTTSFLHALPVSCGQFYGQER
jgi:hypothetical protein